MIVVENEEEALALTSDPNLELLEQQGGRGGVGGAGEAWEEGIVGDEGRWDSCTDQGQGPWQGRRRRCISNFFLSDTKTGKLAIARDNRPDGLVFMGEIYTGADSFWTSVEGARRQAYGAPGIGEAAQRQGILAQSSLAVGTAGDGTEVGVGGVGALGLGQPRWERGRESTEFEVGGQGPLGLAGLGFGGEGDDSSVGATLKEAIQLKGWELLGGGLLDPTRAPRLKLLSERGEYACGAPMEDFSEKFSKWVRRYWLAWALLHFVVLRPSPSTRASPLLAPWAGQGHGEEGRNRNRDARASGGERERVGEETGQGEGQGEGEGDGERRKGRKSVDVRLAEAVCLAVETAVGGGRLGGGQAGQTRPTLGFKRPGEGAANGGGVHREHSPTVRGQKHSSVGQDQEQGSSGAKGSRDEVLSFFCSPADVSEALTNRPKFMITQVGEALGQLESSGECDLQLVCGTPSMCFPCASLLFCGPSL